jgi:1-acyl-sn-glycerol-3-phosphate acyltransferase
MLFQYFKNAFVSKASVINAPVMGIVSQAMGCVFIGRGVSQAERDGLVEQIADRQR